MATQVPPLRRAARIGRRGLAAVHRRALAMKYRVRQRVENGRASTRRGAATLNADLAADTATGGLQVVADRVVVDVHQSAHYDLHTGIQQVVRRTLPLWERDHPLLAAAWTASGSGLRPLSEPERRRVLQWGDPDPTPPVTTSSPAAAAPEWGRPPTSSPEPAADPVTLVVPWRTVVVFPETPPEEVCERLAGLAQYSGNAVVAVGYDCIPIVSADLVPAADTQRFARFLGVLKHARRIAGISRSAATEFAGFAAALPAQGLPGPVIVECPLPTQPAAPEGTAPTAAAPPGSPTLPAPAPAAPAAAPTVRAPAAAPAAPAAAAAAAAAPTVRAPAAAPSAPAPTAPGPGRAQAIPVVLCVGSLEPRKNHLALLYAAERLWRDGLHFQLLLIAGSGWGHETPDRIAHLQAQGRPLTIRTGVSDTDLAAAYRQARFSVFASLHEGYGLPVAESLASGTPVITTNYGSTHDTAAGGGAILIDPRDDDALTEAMRSLLTDDHRLATLRQQLHTRPTRTWEHYAHDLWHHLVQPELPAIGSRALTDA